MHKFVTLGEVMLRLSPPPYQRFIQAKQFDINIGGSEANVAASLAALGIEAYFVTMLPDHEIGDLVISELRKHSIKTDYILRGGSRVGIYFLEIGAAQRPSKVIYDRESASVTLLRYELLNWDEVLNGASWFHITGITPALSETLADTVLKVVTKAKALGIMVSCDLNYRKKLWSPDRAREVMSSIVEKSDLVIGNEEDAELVFGIKAPRSNVEAGKIDVEGYKYVCIELTKKFKNLKYVAITLRESISAFDNLWSAVLWDGDNFYVSNKYSIHVVDRVGSGDSFSAGLIYGLLNKYSPSEALEFAVALSCLKHSVHGDFNIFRKDEVIQIIKTGGTGRIIR